MRVRRSGALLALAGLLSGCGGGGGSLGGTPSGGTGATPTPTPVSSVCGLRARQDWVAGIMRSWYLFPETLPTMLDPAAFGTVQAYIDALTATARAQGKDRYFTYITSIAEENAYFNSGATAGFGIRLDYSVPNQIRVLEAYEGAPALAAGIDRGAVIRGIGTTPATIRSVADIYAGGGFQAVSDALGPNTAGTSRSLEIVENGAVRTVTLAKADYTIQPVSPRYGVKLFAGLHGRQIGYVNLRTFIGPAEPQLRAAFQQMRDANVTHLVVDFRYNGGGLVSIAELMGDLMGRDRFTSDVFSYTTFRPEQAAENEQRNFRPQPQSIAPARVSFIGTTATASASELVMNAFIPYLGRNSALIGFNTYGKPVGQIAFSRPECDDRFRIVAFATQNRDRQGAYYNGLASVMPCVWGAEDNVAYPLGQANEQMLSRGIDFLNNDHICPGGSAAEARSQSLTMRTEMLQATDPSVAQRDLPGLF